jgi:hypothetical protein
MTKATDTNNEPQATPVHTIGNKWILEILRLVLIKVSAERIHIGKVEYNKV